VSVFEDEDWSKRRYVCDLDGEEFESSLVTYRAVYEFHNREHFNEWAAKHGLEQDLPHNDSQIGNEHV
jgi:hypothetical protein